MQKTPGSFDTDPPLYNEALQFPHPPSSSFTSSVSAGRPAKRITFYKSGDAQFKGVKMAIHKRSFKCFDALLDDLSQKVPLPFGVRTIMTPRGTHSIKHLDQLQDGGCYLCSDRRCVKPIKMEDVGKRPEHWHHHSHTHTPRRRPSRPEEPHTGHTHHRQPKRIILVKNGDPAVRRSVVLSRRTARSLRVFMDDISQLMQCHVRKLYTLEGRKIDSVQSLMQCPSVLVCVGREPFRPPLMESLKKLSDEKLPGVGTRSHSSNGSDGHESKKNVNFGLETKKSIIHPRSDSSNRSTRFSLSSEKSYQNGLCMTPGQSGCVSNCPYVKEVVVNDDIEKRVLVNKDGSLSVEMKVRFRLFNHETLQWSTEIKKSSTKVSESGLVKETEYLQAKAEYSDPDSVSASETDEAFATKLDQKHLEETYCENCCNHCQEYDIWKNPMHKDQEACKSPSSSGSSHKVVRKKSSMDSTRTISRSSGECVEHVVEKSSCFQETMEEGDTKVQICAIRRCCSRSEVSSGGNASKSEKDVENKCCHAHITELEVSPMPQFEVSKVGDERPISAVSNSSNVLQSLKEDQDDEYDDLPPSVSRASDWSQSDHLESHDQARCSHCCVHQASPQSYLSPRPPSKDSSSAVQSLKLKKYKTNFAAPIEPNGMSTASPVSKLCSNCPLNCLCGAVTPSSVASGKEAFKERNSQKSCKSKGQTITPGSKASEICNDAPANRSLSATSLQRISGVCLSCGEGKKVDGNEQEQDDSILSRSNKSTASTSNGHENCEPVNNTSEGKATRERSESGVSKNSHAFSTSKMSKKSICSAHEKCSVGKSEHNEVESIEERTKSAMSAKSACIKSEREPTPALILTETDIAEENGQERAVSPMSARSNLSTASKTSHKSMSAHSHKAKTPRSCSPNDLEKVPSKLLNSQGDKPESAASQNHSASDHQCKQDKEFPQEVRPASAMSNKSKSAHLSLASVETKWSVRSCCELQNKDIMKSSSPDVQCDPKTEVTAEERLCSPLSNFSKRSVKSNVSSKHSCIESVSAERVPSALSVKTNASKQSCKSHKSNHNVPETTVTSVLNDTMLDESAKSNRTTSAMSQTSEKSNACSERSVKSGVMDNSKNATQNALTVTSPLPRRKRPPSPRSTIHNKNKKTDSRATSGMSENLSLQSQRSSKCKCHSGHLRETKPEILKDDPKDESEDRLSAKSSINNVKSSGNQFDEPLSPTSTASVSLGLGEEHKDLDERSTSGLSVNTEHKAVNGVNAEERPTTEASVSSAISGRSKKSKNCKTPVQVLLPESVTSAELKKSKSESQLNENNIRVPSTLSLSSSKSKSSSRVSKGRAKNTAKEERDCEAVNSDHAEMTEVLSKHGECERATPASDCLNSSKASERSAKSKNSMRECDRRLKCSQCLEINVTQNGENDGGTSIKTSTDRRSVKNDASRPNSAVMSDVSESLQLEMSNKKKTPVKCPDTSSESVLSRALSAADLLREIVGNSRPGSRGSKSGASSKSVNKVEDKSQKSSRSKHSEVSVNKEMMPSCLPNASPTDVVNDWLRNIPNDGFIYEMDGEITEERTLAQGGEEVEKCEAENSIIEVEELTEDQEAVHQEVNKCVETEDCNVAMQLEKCEMDPNNEVLTKQDSLQKQSQVQVMKVLLGPKLDRSSSLPEVSSVYGRKLSQSAQGLLDCLASLRLIDSDSKNEKQQKYNEVMMILQSLWLQKPSEDEQMKQNAKENQSAEDEYNPHSSSGVDVSSGSGSGKGSMNGVVEKIETAQGTIPPIAERGASVQDNDDVKTTTPAREGLDPVKDISDSVTSDIAERVQGSPVNPPPQDNQENGGIQEEDAESSANKNESDQTPQTTSYKSSGNESYTVKSTENTSSGTPPSVQRAPLVKRVSQDPDPVWVLSLLKKLEKQFMLHYADAMAEFKVRWDLDDNEMLDAMIKELKDEVHKRIQLSINRELQKIQSRAGRSPRPPGNVLSRESTGQTEQRRKRLRVMRNKSITMSGSDDNYTASGTENSDQRSDDEYCPCDACIKKKMASRAAQRAEALTLAPVMMEFDLRKILQMKINLVKPQALKPEATNLTSPAGIEECNLDVLHEEVEDTNEIGTANQEEPGDEEQNTDSNNEGINNERESGDAEGSEDEQEKDDLKDEKEVNNDDAEEEEAEAGIKKEDDCEKKESLEDKTANKESCEMPEEEKEVRAREENELADNGAQTVTEDQSAESKPNNEDTLETTEGEKSYNVLKEESESERNAIGSADPDGISDTGHDEENVPSSKVKIEVEVTGDETNACSSVESGNNDGESTLAKQVTRTSVESQPGSMDNCTNQTALTKLKELQSFMESVESQGEMVVIMKQAPYKESGKHAEMCNGLSEWQMSPKISNRANKQNK